MKRKVKVTLGDVDPGEASANEIYAALAKAILSVGASCNLHVEELECSCGSDAWPMRCAYHNRSYGL